MDDQDLFQEALIHLWSRYSAGHLDNKTDSYILQGCYFHLKNYIRKVQDRATVVSLAEIMDGDGGRLEELLSADDTGWYSEVEGRLQIEALERSGLSPRERDVLSFCLQGMTTREIGKKLGISHVSVIKARNRVREKYLVLNGSGVQLGNATNGTKGDPSGTDGTRSRLLHYARRGGTS